MTRLQARLTLAAIAAVLIAVSLVIHVTPTIGWLWVDAHRETTLLAFGSVVLIVTALVWTAILSLFLSGFALVALWETAFGKDAGK